VLTVFDKETQTFLVPTGWVDSATPAAFLSTTGFMNMAKFRDFIAGMLQAYGQLLDREAIIDRLAVDPRFVQEFQTEAALARGEDDPAT
jgi:hypothetical protein